MICFSMTHDEIQEMINSGQAEEIFDEEDGCPVCNTTQDSEHYYYDSGLHDGRSFYDIQMYYCNACKVVFFIKT